MPSTYSGNLAIELIGTGDQAGTWGGTTNTNLGTAIEQAITSTASVTFVSGGNSAIALAQTNAFQAARSARLNLTGTINATQYLYVPAINKFYVINNPLTNVVIVSNGANGAATGTTVSIPPGTTTLVYNDGTNIVSPINYLPALANVSIDGGTSNNVQSSNVVIVSGTVGNTTINAYTEGITTGFVNTGSAYTINIANSTIITANLSATCTFTMPTATAGKSFILMLKTGAGTNTATFTNVKFVGNTAPTITATANRMDILTFTADGTNWYGNYAQGYVP